MTTARNNQTLYVIATNIRKYPTRNCTKYRKVLLRWSIKLNLTIKLRVKRKLWQCSYTLHPKQKCLTQELSETKSEYKYSLSYRIPFYLGSNLYTLISVFIFSTLFSLHFLWFWQEEFVWKSCASLIGDHILYSHDLLLNSGVKLKGEIRCQSPLGVKGFKFIEICLLLWNWCGVNETRQTMNFEIRGW